MKRLLLITILLGALIPVYRPGSILPEWYIQKNEKGEVRVYSPDQIIIPRYIIKDGKVFEPGKPLLPKYETQEKGGAK
jgi:hypothetical protein